MGRNQYVKVLLESHSHYVINYNTFRTISQQFIKILFLFNGKINMILGDHNESSLPIKFIQFIMPVILSERLPL